MQTRHASKEKPTHSNPDLSSNSSCTTLSTTIVLHGLQQTESGNKHLSDQKHFDWKTLQCFHLHTVALLFSIQQWHPYKGFQASDFARNKGYKTITKEIRKKQLV